MFEETLYQKGRDGGWGGSRVACRVACGRVRGWPSVSRRMHGASCLACSSLSLCVTIVRPLTQHLAGVSLRLCPLCLGAGVQFVDVLKGQGILPGIKVDTGLNVSASHLSYALCVRQLLAQHTAAPALPCP